MARYPKIRVRMRSANPLALVSAVRLELRRAGVGQAEIRRFSDEALEADDSGNTRKVCRSWVDVRS